MWLRWLLLRGGGVAVLLWAAVWSRHLERLRGVEVQRRAGELVDGMGRMSARWRGEAEQGGPRLGDLPDRASWERCMDGQSGIPNQDPSCVNVRAAAAFFPPPSAELGRRLSASWRGDEFPVPNLAYVVSWYADVDPAEMSPSELLLLASCTAPLLGAPIEGNATSLDAISGQEALRTALQQQCGSCAPSGRLLPTYSLTPFPVSIGIAAEVGARGVGTLSDPVAPLGSLAVTVRRGQAVPAEALQRPGQAGLVALEWGRQGGQEHLPELLQMAAEGPSAADRLAALYAALRCSGGIEGAKKWEGLPGSEVALSRAQAVAAALDL